MRSGSSSSGHSPCCRRSGWPTTTPAPCIQVCRRLDGLPLAIELAAARLRILSSAQLAERLGDIFSVLVGGARFAPPRHQALRATLDWSHDLLYEDERTVFRRLAPFAGGFTLHAAEWVAAGRGHPPGRGAGPAHPAGGQIPAAGRARRRHARYFLLATIRDYARERLAQTPEYEPVRRAYLHYYTDLVEQAGARLGPRRGRRKPGARARSPRRRAAEPPPGVRD